MYYIPTQPTPYYSQYTSLDDQNYEFTFRWSVEEQAWYLDLREINDTVTINGIKLVEGCDLLAPYAKTSLGQLWLLDMNEQYSEPNYDDMGTRYRLVYIGKDETV